jgi:hypothetical protein
LHGEHREKSKVFSLRNRFSNVEYSKGL